MVVKIKEQFDFAKKLDNQELIEFVSIRQRIAKGKAQGLSIHEIIYRAKQEAVIQKLKQGRAMKE